MDVASDNVYFSTKFRNPTTGEVTQDNFDIVFNHVRRENHATKQLKDYLTLRAKAEAEFAKRLVGDLKKLGPLGVDGSYEKLAAGIRDAINGEQEQAVAHKSMGEKLGKLGQELDRLVEEVEHETGKLRQQFINDIDEGKKERKKAEKRVKLAEESVVVKSIEKNKQKAKLEKRGSVKDPKEVANSEAAQASIAEAKQNLTTIAQKWKEVAERGMASLQKIEEQRYEKTVGALKTLVNTQLSESLVAKKRAHRVRETLNDCDALDDIKRFIKIYQTEDQDRAPLTPSRPARTPGRPSPAPRLPPRSSGSSDRRSPQSTEPEDEVYETASVGSSYSLYSKEEGNKEERYSKVKKEKSEKSEPKWNQIDEAKEAKEDDDYVQFEEEEEDYIDVIQESGRSMQDLEENEEDDYINPIQERSPSMKDVVEDEEEDYIDLMEEARQSIPVDAEKEKVEYKEMSKQETQRMKEEEDYNTDEELYAEANPDQEAERCASDDKDKVIKNKLKDSLAKSESLKLDLNSTMVQQNSNVTSYENRTYGLFDTAK